MTTLVEISKRGPRLTAEQREEQKRNRTQARVGLASNVVGLGAGAAGLYGAAKVPELWKKTGSEIPATAAKKVTGKAKWVAGGLLGLQAANLGGDVVANRVLARSAAKPETKVKKSAGKVAGATAATSAAGAAGAAALKKIGEGARAGVEQGAKKRSWLLPTAVVAGTGAGTGGVLVARRRKDKVEKNDGTWTEIYISKSDHTGGHGSIEKAFIPKGGAGYGGKKSLDPEKLKKLAEGRAAQKRLLASTRFNTPEEIIRARQAMRGTPPISKAYRRYDPEADRQRRLGLAAGAGVGGAALLGGSAARQYTTKVALRDGGEHLKGIAVKPKRGKAALLLTGGAVASGGLGALAYRRGLSERNNPWN